MSTNLRRKLLWLMAARAVAVTLLLGSAILVQINAPGALPVDPFFFLIGLTYAVTAAYAITARAAERHRWLVDLQLAGDALIVSAIVHVTGGIASYFSSLYALPIVAASIVQSRRGGLTVGVLSTVIYSGLVTAQYTGLVGPGQPAWGPAVVLPPLRVALFTVGLNLFGFLGVALLSGYLAEGLRRADATLRRTTNALADLRAFSQHVIDSLTSGLATTDTQERVLTFNRAAEAITGVTAIRAVGRSVSSVLQLPEEHLTLLRQGREGERVRRVDFKFQREDGRAIELGLSLAPLITPAGRAGHLYIFQDVTDFKRLEREARMQHRLAAVGEMAAGIAHEIRNPLASMSGSIQILRQELPLSEEQAQLMDIVLRESERLNETIRSFLAYARPQRLSTTRMDLRRIVEETAVLLRNSAEVGDGHRIEIHVPDHEVWYEADEAQIRQVVWNLASNGVRAMPSGGRLRLTVDHDRDAPELAFTVQDEGVGIPPEELDRIFQPFRGAFERGTGLGLAIVHRIVSDYGGEVQVTSQPDVGTTVRVRLPLEIGVAGRA